MISNKQRTDIHRLRRLGHTQRKIADRVQVSESTVCRILHSPQGRHTYATVFDAIAAGGDTEQDQFRPKDCDRPTECSPGTVGKINALASRVESGESLWHPLDRQSG